MSEACRVDGKCFFDGDDGCDDGEERRSIAGMTVGIVLLGGGGAAALLGAVSSGLCSGGNRCREEDQAKATAAVVAGGVAALAGLTLLIWGAGKERRPEPAAVPELTLGPASASLRWQW
jgi:hypothetical protein